MHVLYKEKIFPAEKKEKLLFKLFKEKNLGRQKIQKNEY